MRKTIKKTLLDALKYFGALFVCCALCAVPGLSIFYVIGQLIGGDNRQVARITFFIPLFLLFNLVLFNVSYRMELKREKFIAYETALSTFLACALQVLLASVTIYSLYTCGPALMLAQITYAGKDIKIDFPDASVPNHMYVICMVIIDAFYIGSTILGGYLGQMKRKKNRERLQNEASRMKGEKN